MTVKCLFCENNVVYDDDMRNRPYQTRYLCDRCGHVYLTYEASDDFEGTNFLKREKKIMSIVIRNEFEKRSHRKPNKPLTLEDLKQIVKQYRRLDPLAKMDNALVNMYKTSSFVSKEISIDCNNDYPYYHCFEASELVSITRLLRDDDLILCKEIESVSINDTKTHCISIISNGYRRLREIMKPGKESRQCFVAMWFKPEMNEVFEKAIKPAIEFIEEGESSPRYEAVKIDNIEHINDINDEIISQIRRSRFMVCDLTGYRGGVYFEAGFAYGLGLDVIYTCRKDWVKEEILRDKEGNEIPILYDNNDNEIQIKKEGVHFDLAHRNRIDWSSDNLEGFQASLENRIKANIF